MKPKSSGNDPKGIVNKDLGCVSQIFLPKTMGNDTLPCGFIYVIVPILIQNYSFLRYRTLGNKPKEIVNEDLGYVSQIFLPKTMGNDPKPCGFVYLIAPIDLQIIWPLIYATNSLINK